MSDRVRKPLATTLSRRRVLHGAGALAAAVTLPDAFADAAGGVNIGMRAYTAIFPGGDGIHFDHAYYRDVHLPQMQTLYGAALMRVEMRRPVVAASEAPSPYAAIVNFWIPDAAAFATASAAHGQTQVEDRARFTNGMQEVQSEEVFAEVGKPASAIGAGARCLTVLYPYAAADRFNAEYYRDHHMTALIKLFGHATISRIEMRKGLAAADGTPPRYSGTVNIYIADLEGFTALAPANHQRIVDDIPNFTSVSPISFQTEVVGAFDNS
jgi:uncharacterized protein (TIGR02118 family)